MRRCDLYSPHASAVNLGLDGIVAKRNSHYPRWHTFAVEFRGIADDVAEAFHGIDRATDHKFADSPTANHLISTR
jgi:hypothetical protein